MLIASRDAVRILPAARSCEGFYNVPCTSGSSFNQGGEKPYPNIADLRAVKRIRLQAKYVFNVSVAVWHRISYVTVYE